MLIYLITNSVNGKIYVGKHSGNSLLHRWKFHVYDACILGLKSHLHAAIRKYGVDAFKVAKICNASSLEELNTLEIYHIDRLKSYLPSVGYNMTLGGDGGRYAKHRPDTLEKMSEVKRGEKNPFFEKTHIAANRKKMG